jgi:hypothetical protein
MGLGYILRTRKARLRHFKFIDIFAIKPFGHLRDLRNIYVIRKS